MTYSRHTRDWARAMMVGGRSRCPRCETGTLFSKYLKVKDSCDHCGEELHHHRADDAPPYFTIFIVGHIMVPLVLAVDRMWEPALWLHAVLWIPMTLLLSLVLLPCVKGAIVGLQWALKMHGFEYSSKNARPGQILAAGDPAE